MARVVSAIVFIPVLMAALWVGGPVWFTLIASLGLLLGLYEYYVLARCGGVAIGLVATMALLTAFFTGHHEWVGGLLAVLVVTELLFSLWRQRNKEDHSEALPLVAARLTGVLYIGLLGSYLVGLRVIESSIPQLPAKLLTFFFIVIFAGDTGAFYTGKSIGRHKLAPLISPGKTWEGVVGGLAGNLLAAVIARLTFFPELPAGHLVPLAVVMGILGIAGDLCESMIKRGAKAKDAGKLIPGHGGLLDRLDSMLFNAPLLYYYALFLLL